MLDATGSPSLSAINEDDTTSAGTLITSLISSGGSGYISDVDAGALQGLAITAADTTSGSWQYTTDGTTWLALGAVSNINARLLAADGTTRIRFVPNVNFNGTADFTFRAWDMTSGASLAATPTPRPTAARPPTAGHGHREYHRGGGQRCAAARLRLAARPARPSPKTMWLTAARSSRP